MIGFKGSSIRIDKLTQAQAHILNCAADTRDELGYPKVLVVTSINDGSHSKTPVSRHYTDEALDFRTQNNRTPGGSGDMGSFKKKSAFRKLFQSKLGNRFLAQIHSGGTANEHIHAQVRKGHRYP